ncbi:MAG: hypothetical protein CVU07_12170 [Bacteroidetes bacterium HGW-Bacteroidetes-23]|nr:MAG: hypothetical protein CVU07_12170 [Bacteroidetes bacterium HGW-Bacteroidetes-23]
MAQQTVVWSQKAQIKLFIIMEFYTVRNGSPAYATKLYAKFKKALKTLFKQPEIGISTDFENIRGLVVDEYILFYESTKHKITVHTLWDCRQNPEDLKIL